MGLSGPRKRAKLSHDPNNTNWSRSESKYGQRILQAQGWRPGDYLGARNASHAKYHTVANSSHIKIALREENLGIGARVGAAGGEWETTGLDSFQDLLGRLNGKSEEELEEVQKSREVFKRNRYVEQRWGTLRFVRGGLLVGDRVEETDNHEEMPDSTREKTGSAREAPSQSVSVRIDQNLEGSPSKKKKKTKKIRKSVCSNVLQSEKITGDIVTAPAPVLSLDVQQRAEKAERKTLRKQRRESRHQQRSQDLVENLAPISAGRALRVESEGVIEVPTPTALRNGIQTVRKRHIKQKRMTMMDSKALKEILMIKA